MADLRDFWQMSQYAPMAAVVHFDYVEKILQLCLSNSPPEYNKTANAIKQIWLVPRSTGKLLFCQLKILVCNTQWACFVYLFNKSHLNKMIEKDTQFIAFWDVNGNLIVSSK